MIRTILIAWVILECLTYALFFSQFSFLAGLALGLGSTLAGLLTVKIAGRRFVIVTSERIRSGTQKFYWSAETLLILAALLLLMPGFLSDLVGLLLLGAAGLWPRKNVVASRPGDIELSRDDWRRLPDDPPK